MSKECKQCGAPMPDEANFCLNCFTVYGEPIINDNNDPGAFVLLKSKLSGINKKRFALVAAALLCILLIAGSALYLNSDAIRLTGKTPDKDKTVVSSTTDDDGSVKTEYDDGSVETKKPDGTVITEETDGTVITEGADGTVVTETPDDTVITEKPDGTVITEEADGTVVTETPDDTIITEKPDGTVITEEADGTVSTKKPDGTVMTEKKPVETTTAPSTTKPSGIFGSLFEKPSTTEPASTTTTKLTSNSSEAATQRPSSAATKPATATDPASTGTTESTTKKPANTTTTTTTRPASTGTTEPATQKPTTTEKETTTKKQEAPSINYNDFTFEYKEVGRENRLCITKYTGNDEVVTVPYEYNGEYVYQIYGLTFYKSKAKKIIFTACDEYAPFVVTNAIYDCDALEEIDFYWSDYENSYNNSTISGGFAVYCDKLSKVVITGCDKYKAYENGVYRKANPLIRPNSWDLIEVWGTEWHQPSWCISNQNALQFAPNMKTIYLNPVSSGYSAIYSFLSSTTLEAVYIDKSNPYFFDDNGVVYDKINMRLAFYPKKKPESTYHFLDGHEFDNYGGPYNYSQYLNTVYIPKNFKILGNNYDFFLTHGSLKTIYIQEGNSDIAELQSKYGSKISIIVYQ